MKKPKAAANAGNTMQASSRSPEILLTKQEVATQLSCCPRTVDNLINSRALPPVKIGRSVRIRQTALTRFIDSCTEYAA